MKIHINPDIKWRGFRGRKWDAWDGSHMFLYLYLCLMVVMAGVGVYGESNTLGQNIVYGFIAGLSVGNITLFAFVPSHAESYVLRDKAEIPPQRTEET